MIKDLTPPFHHFINKFNENLMNLFKPAVTLTLIKQSNIKMPEYDEYFL